MHQENTEKFIPLPLAVLALVGVAALLCFGVVIAIIVIPSISQVLTNLSYYDDDIVLLSEALSARSDPDDSIPSAVFGIQGTTNSSPDAPWVVIELSYTEKCTDTIEDPCEQLADEFAHIVLEQHARVNDINGLQIIITNHAVYGPVLADTLYTTHFGKIPFEEYLFERSTNYLVKSMTIERWREKISTEQG